MNIFTYFSRATLAVFLTLTFTGPFAMAQGVDLPDPNLRTQIEGHLSKSPGDAITKADMQTLTLLSAVNAGIHDLTGLEHATNLIYLELSRNAISNIAPLVPLTQLALLYLDNNPLSAASLDTHLPALRARGVEVSYTLPSDVNGDGMVSVQDIVFVAQHFGTSNVAADVNKDGIVNISDLTRTANAIGDTPVNADPDDSVDTPDPAPGEKPPREAFLFRKFLEQMLSDRKAIFPAFDYDVETIFQTPGEGFYNPSRTEFGAVYAQRPWRLHMLGIFVPDALTTASTSQVNKFSAEYKLTIEELTDLLRNLRRASILVLGVIEVYMPDKNLRKVVVAKINEQAALVSGQREVPEIFFIRSGGPKKPSSPIYEGEMHLIGTLKAEAAGIESLIGLEYAINLKQLQLGNPYHWTWDVIFLWKDDLKHEYKVTKPEAPNQISDITPLRNLKKLESLDIGYNAVSDLGPLAQLENLQYLNLGENKITDISPLKNLTNLTFLSLRNEYYSPEWAGNNAVRNLSPLGNLSKLEGLYVDHNRIGSEIDIVRSLPKLNNLSAGCCGVSNLRPFLEHPRLGRAEGRVYLTYSSLTAEDVPDLEALLARGVKVDHGMLWTFKWEDDTISVEGFPPGQRGVDMVSKTFKTNNVEKCSERYRESRRALSAAPALQLSTKPDMLSSLWRDLSQVPEKTALLPNYPNPFNPETWIPYQLATSAEVRVAIHAADGRLVRTLALGYQAAGVYQSKGRAAYWDGRNAQGEPVASGVYFYTLMTGDFTATKKLLIRK